MLIATTVVGAEISQSPVVPGLQAKHPLDERQVGEILINELRCAACHSGMIADHMKEAPDLRTAGSRLSPAFIKRFVADPSGVHPGTTMPGVLGALTPEKRDEAAESISYYLSSLKNTSSPDTSATVGDPEVGKELFHSIGCVSCHSPRDESGNEIRKDGVVTLSHLSGKFKPGELAAFLHAPLKVRPSGRMPDMKLSKSEAASLASYLGGTTVVEPIQPTDADRIAAGKKAFETNNCTACHQTGETALPVDVKKLPLAKLDLSRGCLSSDAKNAPQFHLDSAQKNAIQKAILETGKPTQSSDLIKMRLVQMNCIACHVRDDFGGVAQTIDGYFHSTEEALGNESRIPPPLTLLGAKLRPEWLNAVLYDGRTVRPYMKTRMPQFGESGLAGMPALFTEVDHMPSVDLTIPEKEFNRELRDDGLKLLGDKGLNCIACHNFNGKDGPGMKGLDIMTSYQRLQPAWFSNYMQNPAAFRPGIIMPSYWPNGKAVQTGILGGDTNQQLRVLWNYFSLGRSAGDPSGLRSEPSNLAVSDKVRTYRGRSSVAGFRGIAVGFPGGINYAFNAQNGSLSAIWPGDYVRVNWQGQGAGDFNPVGKSIPLAQDVAFIQSVDAPTPWPLRPITTKENPVNPDPLYPHNHGYQFVGYSLDESAASVPTFDYRCGKILINDRSVRLLENDSMVLKRDFQFTTAQADTIWFRALSGKIDSESKSVFKIPGLKIMIAPAESLLRAGANGEQELLIKLPLPKGKSTFTIQYELLR